MSSPTGSSGEGDGGYTPPAQEGAATDTVRRGVSTPLHIAVIIDAGAPAKWVVDLLAELRSTHWGQVVLVLQLDAPSDDGKVGGHAPEPERGEAHHHRAYRTYRALDRRVFGAGPDPCTPVHMDAVARDLPLRRVASPRSGRARGAVVSGPEIVDALRGVEPDVVLHLGAGPLAGGLPDVARYGAWALVHGNDGNGSAESAGVWEVLNGSSSTTLGLRRIDGGEGAGGSVVSRIRTHRLSVGRNREQLFRKAALLVRNWLHELHASGLRESASASEGQSAPGPVRGGTSMLPTPREVVTALTRIGTWGARRAAQRGGWQGGWSLAFHRGKGGELEPLGRHRSDLVFLNPPPDRFWADPFPVASGNRHFVFFEEYLFDDARGRIAVTEVGADGCCSPPVPVLERDYHLSYPFVFEWEGVHYMVPETLAAGRVEAYRSTSFPHRWVHHGTLLDGIHAVDPTLVELDGTWWLFASVCESASVPPDDWNEQLHLFHAPSPFGPWTPHRRNPVKWDVHGSRPAGRFFRRNGALYRPAQDCAERYGHSIRIFRVDRLDRDEYRESEVMQIVPTWAPSLIGTHTLNSAGGLTVVDGRFSYLATRRMSGA